MSALTILATQCLAGRITVGHISTAGEAGHRWHDLGCAVNMLPGSMTGNMHERFGGTAFSDVSGHEPHASFSGNYVTWECVTCDNTIKDYGPGRCGIVGQHGHPEHCSRLNATIDTPGQRTPVATFRLVGGRSGR